MARLVAPGYAYGHTHTTHMFEVWLLILAARKNLTKQIKSIFFIRLLYSLLHSRFAI